MKGEILTSLGHTPRVMERLVRVFPPDRLDDRLNGAQFTAREAIASLADNEVIILDRIRLANTKPGASVDKVDPVARAKEHHYSDKNIFHEAEVYESRRLTTIEYLRGLEGSDWEKTLVISGETVTIADYVSLVLSNDLFHLDQISSFLATEVATIS